MSTNPQARVESSIVFSSLVGSLKVCSAIQIRRQVGSYRVLQTTFSAAKTSLDTREAIGQRSAAIDP